VPLPTCSRLPTCGLSLAPLLRLRLPNTQHTALHRHYMTHGLRRAVKKNTPTTHENRPGVKTRSTRPIPPPSGCTYAPLLLNSLLLLATSNSQSFFSARLPTSC